MSKKTFYITTPIYYPSGNLHIGHVYTTTLARTLANYKILNGYDVKFLTGADEHGQKIKEKAEESKMNPQEYVDLMSGKFKELWTLLDIQYDYFSRTTNKKHIEAVSKQFSDLFKEGEIYKGEYKGLYSTSDEEFLTITQAEERDGKFYHPQSGHELKEISEESYFFRMSSYENWWKEYIKENPDFIIPEKIIKELSNNFVDKGLSDLSVTRSTFDWGIPVKEDDKHVMYVWLDALNNYITALGYNSEDDSDFQKYWVNGDEIVHIVGKEITRFHGIYWPIILKASNLRLPTTILSHGWIVTPEGKMSKSKGNVIDPIQLIEKYGAEVVKYFFASQINIGQDKVFDEELLKSVYNADLANNYGNLVSRTIAMTLQNFDEPIKHANPTTKDDEELLNAIISHTNKYKEEFDNFQISKAFEEMIILAKKLNGYIDVTMPWTLKDDKVRLSEVLNNLLNGIYAITTMISVVMPRKANEVMTLIGQEDLSLENISNFNKFDNKLPKKGEILFERIK